MANRFNRRIFVKGLGASVVSSATISPFFGIGAAAQEDGGHRGEIFRICREFMKQFRVPGMSIAISRHGRLVYEHQFGMADVGNAQQVLPSSLFRIASVSRVSSGHTTRCLDQGQSWGRSLENRRTKST